MSNLAPSPPAALFGNRAKSLDSTQFSYKLGGSSFGMDVALPDKLDFNESKMSAWIPFGDGRNKDGVGDILEVAGINLERHRKLPNVLFDHGKDVKLPIGMACERDEKGAYDYSKYTVVIDPVARQAKLNAFFYQGKGLADSNREDEHAHAIFCEQLYHMMVTRLLGAGSIGYQVVKALKLPADYERGTPPGLHLLVTLMLEGSLVVLPANGDTVRKALALPQVCGKPLSPYLVKSLTPYAEPTKAMANGFGTGEKGITKTVPHTEKEDDKGMFNPKKPLPTPSGPVPSPAGSSTRSGSSTFNPARPVGKELGDVRRKYSKKSQPSDAVSPEKARQILHDGEANGQPLTDKQRAMFGAAANKSMNDVVGIWNKLPELVKQGDRDSVSRILDSLSQLGKDEAARTFVAMGFSVDPGWSAGQLHERIKERINSRWNANWRASDAVLNRNPLKKAKSLQAIRHKYLKKALPEVKVYNERGGVRVYVSSPDNYGGGNRLFEKVFKDSEKAEAYAERLRQRVASGEIKSLEGIPEDVVNVLVRSAGTQVMRGEIPDSLIDRLASEGYIRKEAHGSIRATDKAEKEKRSGTGYWRSTGTSRKLGKSVPHQEKATTYEEPFAIYSGGGQYLREMSAASLRNALSISSSDKQRLLQLPKGGELEVNAGGERVKIVREKHMAGKSMQPTAKSLRTKYAKRLAVGQKAIPEVGSVWRDNSGIEYKVVNIRSDNSRGRNDISITVVRMDGPHKDPMSFGQQAFDSMVKVKSLKVQYRSKLIKGYTDLDVAFDVGHLDSAKQMEFYKAMEEGGFGKPGGGKWAEDTKTLLTPLKKARFKFQLEPNQDGTKALATAAGIAAQHGAKLLGQVKSLNDTNREKSITKRGRTKVDGIWYDFDGREQYGKIEYTYDYGTTWKPSKREAWETAKANGTLKPSMRQDKSMQVRTKADPTMDAPVDDGAVPTDLDGQLEQGPAEPFSAQVLKRIHEHHLILMEEYDEMLQVLEHSEIKEYLEEFLQHTEDTLQTVEDLFGKHHSELAVPDTFGAKDDEGVEPELEEGEIPAEEAAEAMNQKKHWQNKYKSTNGYHAKAKGGGGNFGARYNQALEYVTDGASPEDATAEERSQAAAIAHGGGGKGLQKGFAQWCQSKGIKAICPGCGQEPCECGGEGKKHLTKYASSEAMYEYNDPQTGTTTTLKDSQLEQWAANAGFTSSWVAKIRQLPVGQKIRIGGADNDTIMRIKSYSKGDSAYIKSIAKALGKDLTDDELEKVEGQLESAEETLKDEVGDTETKSILCKAHKDALAGAAGFLGEASQHTGSWEDEHRTKAAAWHKAVSEIGADEVPPDEMVEGDGGTGEPGEMGQKAAGTYEVKQVDGAWYVYRNGRPVTEAMDSKADAEGAKASFLSKDKSLLATGQKSKDLPTEEDDAGEVDQKSLQALKSEMLWQDKAIEEATKLAKRLAEAVP